MFVITADQVDSRTTRDRVADALARLARRDDLALSPERTAGDELQVLTEHPSAALEIALDLTREGSWSVGCGVGPVQHPLGPSVRAATGGAFVAAREAVGRAKSSPTRFAVRDVAGEWPHAQALIDLLLIVRERRTDEGWEIVDLLRDGSTQADAAERLGITPQAASQRARAAEWRAERAAVPALVEVLAALDRLQPHPTEESP